MLIEDIDKKVDRKLIIRLRQNTDFFKSAMDLDLTLPVYIFSKGNETWMSTYFPKLEMSQKMDLLIRKFNGKEKENSFVIDTRINNVKDLAIIEKLLDVPSFIVDRSDINRGFLNLHGRFHHSQSEKISGLLADLTLDSENARVDWIGPSDGIRAITDDTHSVYPLSLVEFRVPIEDDERAVTNLISDENTIAEMRNSRCIDGKISVVLYSDGPLEEEFEPENIVSAEDGIYQIDVPNRIHNIVRTIANDMNILRTRYFVRKRTDDLEIFVLLPSNGLYEYYSILFELARKNKEQLSVISVVPYSQRVWEMI